MERFGEDADLVGELREKMWRQGRLVAAVRAGKQAAGAKFSDYFDFAEPLIKIPSHRALAMLRGENEDILTLTMSPEPADRDPLWAADAIEERIEFEGAQTVAAVILEPVQNAGGCFVPQDSYFQRVREICDRHGVLLISDEVICSWGRLGHFFGQAYRNPVAAHQLAHRRAMFDAAQQIVFFGSQQGSTPCGKNRSKQKCWTIT